MVFWTLHISGYLMKPIIDHENFPGAVRNVQKGTKQPNGWFSKKIVHQDCCLFENHPFFCCLSFWMVLIASRKLSWSLIGSISYPDLGKVQNPLKFSNTLKKVRQECPLFFFSFLFDVPNASFEVFIVSNWSYKGPWHVRSPWQLESFLYPWKKCIKAAVTHLAVLGIFGRSCQLLCSPHGL